MMINALIIDDEPLARENLISLLAEHDDIAIVGEASNAIEGIRAIHQLKPDVVFLDIQMPRISGLEMLSMLDPSHQPYVIFVTAFDEYAIQAFEEHAFDYLLKPVEASRLTKTLARLRQLRPKQELSLLENSTCPLKHIPAIGHNRIYLLNIEEILFVSSRLNSIYITDIKGKEYLTELTLKSLEDKSLLTRCHKQHLINLDLLKAIHFDDEGLATAIFTDNSDVDHTVIISRRYLKSLKEQLGLK